jgi:hypothetical protein
LTYDNIKVIVEDFDFNEDEEMENLAHTLKLVRLGKKMRENSKLNKDVNVSSKTTHKKSKSGKKWEDL